MTPSVVKGANAPDNSMEVTADEFFDALQSACTDAGFGKAASAMKLGKKKVRPLLSFRAAGWLASCPSIRGTDLLLYYSDSLRTQKVRWYFSVSLAST